MSGGGNQDNWPFIKENGWLFLRGPVLNIDTGKRFGTIQDAIDDSETVNDHTIFVENGTYYENVIIDKSIQLIGQGRDVTIIDGGGINDVVMISANGVNISGFTITNSRNMSSDAGIDLNGHGNCTIIDNNISGNYYGIDTVSYTHLTLPTN